MRGTRGLIVLVVIQIPAWCEIPVISGFVNAASYQPTLESRGRIVTIFGTNLAGTTATANTVPLPADLGGTSVAVGGVAAPLLYVSPTQINLQVPTDNGGSIVVSTPAGSSAPYDPSTATPGTWAAGGVFTIDGTGCGQAAALNVASNGTVSINSPGSSISPGEYLSLFGTGLTDVIAPPIGVAAPLAPLLPGATAIGLEFDFAGLNNSVVGSWNGLAPGLVGVDQINVQIPTTVREGCSVPIQSTYSTTSEGISQPVTIAVRKGGGQCMDPPSAGYGQVVWQKTVTTTAQHVATETDVMTALLQASPGQQAPALPIYSEGCPGNLCGTNLPSSLTLFGPSCKVPGYRSLGAGAVTIQGAGLSSRQVPLVPYEVGQLGGLSAYVATLPVGTVQFGNFSVTASGGADVGAFQTSLAIGADIQIKTPLAGIDAFANCKPLSISWSGGDPKSWVTVSFIQQQPSEYGGLQAVNFSYQTRVSNGVMTIPFPPPLEGGCTTTKDPVTIAIEVDPDPSEIATFSASGISLGGRATWRFRHTFQASIEVP